MQMVFCLLLGRIKKPTYSWQKPPTGCGICRALKSTDKKVRNETNYNSPCLALIFLTPLSYPRAHSRDPSQSFILFRSDRVLALAQ